MNDFDYDYDASYETDYDPDDYPTAKRPGHRLSREQVQSLVEETNLKQYLEMILLFLALAAMQSATQTENTRLRKMLRNAVLETKR